MWGDGGVYGAWAEVMDRWARGEPADPGALPTLTREQFDGDTWARLTDRITDALNTRMVAWAATTSRGINHAHGEFGVAQALAQSRVGLRTIRDVASCLPLPDDLRGQLVKLIEDQVRQAQEQLERHVDSATRQWGGLDRQSAERRLRTIRDNALTAILTETTPPIVPSPNGAQAQPDVTNPPRRRVIPG